MPLDTELVGPTSLYIGRHCWANCLLGACDGRRQCFVWFSEDNCGKLDLLEGSIEQSTPTPINYVCTHIYNVVFIRGRADQPVQEAGKLYVRLALKIHRFTIRQRRLPCRSGFGPRVGITRSASKKMTRVWPLGSTATFVFLRKSTSTRPGHKAVSDTLGVVHGGHYLFAIRPYRILFRARESSPCCEDHSPKVAIHLGHLMVDKLLYRQRKLPPRFGLLTSSSRRFQVWMYRESGTALFFSTCCRSMALVAKTNLYQPRNSGQRTANSSNILGARSTTICSAPLYIRHSLCDVHHKIDSIVP